MSINPEDIHLSEEQRLRLAHLANQRGTGASELIGELIDAAEALQGIKKGLESVARGEGIAAKDVHHNLRSKFGLHTSE